MELSHSWWGQTASFSRQLVFPIFLRKGEVGKIIYNTKGKLFYRFSENATNIQVSNGCYYTDSLMADISSYTSQLTPVYLLHTENRGQSVLLFVFNMAFPTSPFCHQLSNLPKTGFFPSRQASPSDTETEEEGAADSCACARLRSTMVSFQAKMPINFRF